MSTFNKAVYMTFTWPFKHFIYIGFWGADDDLWYPRGPQLTLRPSQAASEFPSGPKKNGYVGTDN